jgi:hypothetical protein
MRRTIFSSLLLLLCSVSLSAADLASDRFRVSILASEISVSSGRSYAGSTAWNDDPHAGIGVGLAYQPTPYWDVELTVASQTHTSPYTRLLYVPSPIGTTPPGSLYPVTEFHRYRVMPMDVSVSRHFLTDQVIAPYLRAGVRYVASPSGRENNAIFVGGPDVPAIPIQVYEGFGFQDRTSLQAGAGVLVRLTPRTSVRLEADRLLRSEQSDFDPLTRVAAGVTWKF